MDSANLRRYHRFLLKKQREVSFALGEAQPPVPGAGGLGGDLIANTDEEEELQIHLHQTEGVLQEQSRRHSFGLRSKHTYGVREACGHSISKVRLNAVPRKGALGLRLL